MQLLNRLRRWSAARMSAPALRVEPVAAGSLRARRLVALAQALDRASGRPLPPDAVVYGAWLDRRVVGCCAALPGEGRMTLLHLYVRMGYRSRGAASALLRHVERAAAAAGLVQLRATIDFRHIDAVSLLHLAGMEEVIPRERCHPLKITMGKRLDGAPASHGRPVRA